MKTSEGNTVSLASFEGKPLVLFFYPKAATPGCTKEVCAATQYDRRIHTHMRCTVLQTGLSMHSSCSSGSDSSECSAHRSSEWLSTGTDWTAAAGGCVKQQQEAVRQQHKLLPASSLAVWTA